MKLAAALFISITLVITNVSWLAAQSHRNTWHFTPKEIEIAYRYQLDYGKGLKQPLRAGGCMYGATDFSVRYYGEQRQLPCKFIKQTLRHLKEILQAGAARYFFPLDLNHAHLAIPKTSWHEHYKVLPSAMILPAMLHDPQLVALYHSAEHLKAVDSMTGEVSAAVREWQEKRNILGFYDGRPNKILPPLPKGVGVSVPDRYWSYGGFEFLASHSSRLPVILEDSAVAVEIKLDIGGDGLSESMGDIATNP